MLVAKAYFDIVDRSIDDNSVFVQSWSIVSLTIIGLNDIQYRASIIEKIKPMLVSKSIAVRRKAENAISVLEWKRPLPKGWSKKREVNS